MESELNVRRAERRYRKTRRRLEAHIAAVNKYQPQTAQLRLTADDTIELYDK